MRLIWPHAEFTTVSTKLPTPARKHNTNEAKREPDANPVVAARNPHTKQKNKTRNVSFVSLAHRNDYFPPAQEI